MIYKHSFTKLIMKMRMIRDKLGQNTMSLPFGVIFSIFLIIVFIAVAYFAINHFLEIGECGQVGQFYDDLQKQVDDVWNSQFSDNVIFEINLPSGVEKICFVNSSAIITSNAREDYDNFENYIPENNLFLLPAGGSCNMPSSEIKHIDIKKITNSTNPKCFDVSRNLNLSKDFYDKYVTIK